MKRRSDVFFDQTGIHSTIGLRARNRKAGVLAGVPDVIIAYDGKTLWARTQEAQGQAHR
jgi:hypothetical protein